MIYPDSTSSTPPEARIIQNIKSPTMKLTDQQFQTVHEVFQANNAVGYTQALMDIYDGFLQSSNDDIGRMSQDYLINSFHIINQVCRLLIAIEPKVATQVGKEEVC